ncbi:MAG: hypothetical protein MUO75_03520 [Actinobacteria bacterium]|nr:hypothetical protein [Actinomycetota bacterium]
MNRRKRHTKIFFTITALACAAMLAASGCGGTKKPETTSEQVKALLDKGIRPNEMGMVMVLEYHRIEDEESDYTRSV